LAAADVRRSYDETEDNDGNDGPKKQVFDREVVAHLLCMDGPEGNNNHQQQA
jgi:hypothetical protein